MEKDGFLLESRFLCLACVEARGKEAQSRRERLTVARARDATLCARCGRDNGSDEFAAVADVPLCPDCTALALRWPFPRWLRVSAAVLFVLLVAATVRGLPMLGAGMELLRAEQDVAAHRYPSASDRLAGIVAAYPACDKAVLLQIKADLLCDRFAKIGSFVQRLAGKRFEGDLINEVNALLARTQKAFAECGKAAELEQ
jgi:hypothetical protein